MSTRTGGPARLREADDAPKASRGGSASTGARAVAPVILFEAMPLDTPVHGPALIENSFTTIVIDPDATARRDPAQGLIIDLETSAP